MADDVQDIYVSTDAGTEWQSLSALAAEQVGDPKLPIESVDGTVKLSDSAGSFVVSTGGLANASERFRITDDAAIFKNQIRTPSVRGLADNDPVLGLNGLFNFQFKNGDGGDGSKINVGYNETSGTGFSNVGVGGCYWYLRDSKRFGIGATGINFNANAAANASTYDWSMEPDGTFVSNANRGIEAAYITAGRNNSSNAPETAPKITLNGNSALLAGSDGSEYVPTAPASIATKKIVDDKIWVGTTAQYLNIDIRDILPTTLYCLTD